MSLADLTDNLNLTDPEDRAIFRVRVAGHYAHMKLSALREEAGLNSRATRLDCTRRIAERWMLLHPPTRPVPDP